MDKKALLKMASLVEEFIVQVDQMELMLDPSIRNPASKHQRIIKEIVDLVEGFKHHVNVLKDEGKMEK